MSYDCSKCKHCVPQRVGAGFTIYTCRKCPGLVIGESNYLVGDEIREADKCENFEPYNASR